MQVSLNYVDHLLEKKVNMKGKLKYIHEMQERKIFILYGRGFTLWWWYLWISKEVFLSRGCVYIHVYLHTYLINFSSVNSTLGVCIFLQGSLDQHEPDNHPRHSPLFRLTLTSPLLCTDCYHAFFLKATHLKISVWELITIDNWDWKMQ